jgi:hypothetical protein
MPNDDTSHPAIFYGHHKCATHYVSKVIASFCSSTRLSYYMTADPREISPGIDKLSKYTKCSFICYNNASLRYIHSLGSPLRAFHLIRDPRDLAVSAYFSHLYSHSTDNWPELTPHRKLLQKLDIDQGLLVDLDFTDRLPTNGIDIGVFRWLNDWQYDRADILDIRLEDLADNPQQYFLFAFAFLGFDLRMGEFEGHSLLSAVTQNSFERLSDGRPRGAEDVRSHYRTGKQGDWRRYFTKTHKDWFSVNYPNILRYTGYEQSSDW